MPSATPPVRLVSSTTSTRPVARASCRTSSAGSGASQRRSTTRAPIPRMASRLPTRRLIRSPLPKVTMREVATLAVGAGPAQGQRCASGRGYGASQPPSPSLCRSRVWYSAIGSRNTHTEPSTAAAATQVRSIAAASRAATGRRRSGRGCRAARRPHCRCGSGRRSPSGTPARPPGPPSGCGTGRTRRTAGWQPRPGADPRRCAGRPGTGSPAPEQAGQPAAEGQPEDRLLVEQGVEDPGRPEPALQPLGHAVDAALAPDVLAEHAHAGFRVQKVGQRAG